MARIESTNKEVLGYIDEIAIWRKGNSIHLRTNATWIKIFEDRNQTLIQEIMKEVHRIKNEFYTFKRVGREFHIETDEKGIPLIKNGKTDEEFDEVWNAYMNKPVSINIL